MVADNESDVVDGATNDETALLHEDPPAPAPGILHDDVHRSRVLQTLLEHRPVLNRLPVGVGDTAAGRLDTPDSAIDLGASVTNLPADTLEEMRRPRELKPDVELEPFFGVRVSVHESRLPIERAAQTIPDTGDTAFDARKTALHEIGRRRIRNRRVRVVETAMRKRSLYRTLPDVPFPTHTLRDPQTPGFTAPLAQDPLGNVMMVPRKAKRVLTTRRLHDRDLRNRAHIRAAAESATRWANSERLAREGRLHGPSMETERLVSKGYTNAEKALAGNYAKGDVVAFHRPYKRLGVEKGDERRVVGVDHKANAVRLEGKDGGTVAWKPAEIGGRKGGSEVYRSEAIELRAGDRIRWTRNDDGLGLVNSRTAEVEAVTNGRVTLQLEDGRRLELGRGDPQLRHLDHAWASTVHAFQGRTVDNVIAAMEARHPHLTTQKSFYVEISRARDRAELVTDDAAELRAQLQAVTGERIAALEGIGEMPRETPEGVSEMVRTGVANERGDASTPAKDREMLAPERDRGAGMDLGL